ncbi:hypothetical protein [Streptomyces sp. NPDC058579]|uniref:phosphoribosylanthranilate isomerase n=1 Tax=Streptomyces sp. NPDC058579 TaxID=3346548 RepID=UPI00364DF338
MSRVLIRATGTVSAAATDQANGPGRELSSGELGEDLLLLDSPVPGLGASWNWSARAFTAPAGRWLLAGGLTLDNVQEAVRSIAPWGAISSGVKRQQSVKDPGLISELHQSSPFRMTKRDP